MEVFTEHFRHLIRCHSSTKTEISSLYINRDIKMIIIRYKNKNRIEIESIKEQAVYIHDRTLTKS